MVVPTRPFLAGVLFDAILHGVPSIAGLRMDIKRSGSQPSAKGPAEWFPGTVRIDPLFRAPDPAPVAGARVTFAPAARPAGPTTPPAQTLSGPAGSARGRR